MKIPPYKPDRKNAVMVDGIRMKGPVLRPVAAPARPGFKFHTYCRNCGDFLVHIGRPDPLTKEDVYHLTLDPKFFSATWNVQCDDKQIKRYQAALKQQKKGNP